MRKGAAAHEVEVIGDWLPSTSLSCYLELKNTIFFK
uniref:Uncharacterized protein n=1 Tax=Lotus japonicus TaxID=34305 RepID=I3SGS0_LOTJA|nr:unknown [Lotus japonicus]